MVLGLEVEEEGQVLVPVEGGGGTDGEDEGSRADINGLALAQLRVGRGEDVMEGGRMQHGGDVKVGGVEVVVEKIGGIVAAGEVDAAGFGVGG